MTVKELIEELQKYDQDAEVLINEKGSWAYSSEINNVTEDFYNGKKIPILNCYHES